MDSALSPREIQARIRAGASAQEVADEAGVSLDRIEGFALPVIAEREHMARTALAATVRRKGDGTGHRRLSEIISERLRARGMDADEVSWDAWRLQDLRWRLVGSITDDASPREAEFTFDPKGRFSVAHNSDARWMIGEELPGSPDPDNENTVDFNDELALVRATQTLAESPTGAPGDDVPQHEGLYEDPPHTSELDELYDMLSGVSEDSVRIYVGLEDRDDADPVGHAPEVESPGSPADDPDVGEPAMSAQVVADDEDAPSDAEPDVDAPDADDQVLAQDALIEDAEIENVDEVAPKPKTRRRRAQVPSWDEIMFGGPTTK